MTMSQNANQYRFRPITLALAGIFFSTFSLITPNSIAEAAPPTPTVVPSNPAPVTTTTTDSTGIISTPASTTTTTSVTTTTPTITTDNNQVTTKDAPLSQANMSDSAILNWASEAARSAYSYDFKNYAKQMQQIQDNFTTAGWTAFMSALNKSNNLNVVQSKKLVASAIVAGRPTILHAGLRNGVYVWKIEVPITASYENESKLIKQNLIVTMLVTRDNSPDGVGISHFLANVVPASQPITTLPDVTPTTTDISTGGAATTTGTTTPTSIYDTTSTQTGSAGTPTPTPAATPTTSGATVTPPSTGTIGGAAPSTTPGITTPGTSGATTTTGNTGTSSTTTPSVGTTSGTSSPGQ